MAMTSGAETPLPMLERLDGVKWDMLNEWAETKRAPKHADWLHAKQNANPNA